MESFLTLHERVDAYAKAFPQFPDSWPVVSKTGRWLTGVWLLGNSYQGSGYYGAYPPSYLKRVQALFPEFEANVWVHLFSGSLRTDVPGLRIDRRLSGEGVVPPHVVADATALPFPSANPTDDEPHSGFVVMDADPPYTKVDAIRYGTGTLNKRKVLHECARVLRSGGHLIWLDTTLPLYRKDQFHHWGMICVQRSTNHRTRLCSLFTRV